MSNHTPFKRLNFFTGFFTTAQDWTDGQTYHLEKRKLHNRLLHQPGVMEGLTVTPKGGLTVVVEPGAALDGNGNLIYLANHQEITLQRPATDATQWYITIAFAEHRSEPDHVVNAQDPDYSGYTRFIEEPIVCATKTPAEHQIKLASIKLNVDAQTISEPDKPNDPKENEIDRRDVPKAGAKDSTRDRFVNAIKERLSQLHTYYQERQRRQNRGLHKPGILRTVDAELNVVAIQGELALWVQPGTALDANGNQIYLKQAQRVPIVVQGANRVVYLVAYYDGRVVDGLGDLDQEVGDDLCTARIEATQTEPDHQTRLELARITVSENATEFGEPADPANPQSNQIDRRQRRYAGSLGLQPPRLPLALQEQLSVLMVGTRQNFALLAHRFPSPAVADARQTALQIQMALDSLEPEQLPNRIQVMATVEQDVEQELGQLYPRLLTKLEFDAYDDAVVALFQAINSGLPLATVLTRQQAVSEAARNLSQVTFPPPTAHAGPDQTIITETGMALVRLDASASQAAPGHRIVSYRWEKEQ